MKYKHGSKILWQKHTHKCIRQLTPFFSHIQSLVLRFSIARATEVQTLNIKLFVSHRVSCQLFQLYSDVLWIVFIFYLQLCSLFPAFKYPHFQSWMENKNRFFFSVNRSYTEMEQTSSPYWWWSATIRLFFRISFLSRN